MDSDTVGIAPRRMPFTMIENVVIEDSELGPVDVLCYLALARHSDSAGTCWPSMSTIGKLARCGRTAAQKAIANLEARGYLKRSARFRPDGGVTSNFYELLTVKVEAPVPHADPPRPRREQAPRHQVNTNYTHSEQNTAKGEALARETAHCPPSLASHPEEKILEDLADVPELVHDRRFREGCRRLLAEGRTPGEIAQAVRVAAGDPRERGGLSFIADRFPRWAWKAREGERLSPTVSAEARAARERQQAEERARILEEQESAEGRAEIAAALASVPWRR